MLKCVTQKVLIDKRVKVFKTFMGLDWDFNGDEKKPRKGLKWNKIRKGLWDPESLDWDL